MSGTTCYKHRDRAATANCENCNRALCPDDHRTIVVRKQGYEQKKLVCPRCKAKKDETKFYLLVYGTIAGLIVIAVISRFINSLI